MIEEKIRPLFEVFEHRALGVGHMLRDRVWRMSGFAANEPLYVEVVPSDGETTTVRFRRRSDHRGCIEFSHITPNGLANVQYGEETISKSETLGEVSEEVDNRNGVAEVEVSFRDLFSKTDSSESGQSAGGSVKVAVESTQSIEGIAEFKESIETEAHTEFSESQGSSTTSEIEGEEGTIVPVGKRVRITETRLRADGSTPITAIGQFNFALTVGKHSGGEFKSHGSNHRGLGRWGSWQEFVDVVTRNAPDNASLSESFQGHPAYHADLWALDPMDAAMAYEIKFEGRVVRSYRVEKF